MKIDFHLHTWCSDGRHSPHEMAVAVRAAGVDRWAITDHDSVAAWDALRDQPGIVAGVEFTAGLDGREVHIVGLAIDPLDASFAAVLAGQRVRRERRAGQLLDRLPVDVRRGLAVADLHDGRTEAVGRNHIARAIVARGGAATVGEVFAAHLGDDHLIDRGLQSFPHPAEACAAIHAAGGLAILAHPGIYRTIAAVEALVIAARSGADRGFDGLETSHPNLDLRLAFALEDLADRFGLLASCGTDLHVLGRRRPGDQGLDALRTQRLMAAIDRN